MGHRARPTFIEYDSLLHASKQLKFLRARSLARSLAALAPDAAPPRAVRNTMPAAPVVVMWLGLEATGHHGVCTTLAPRCSDPLLTERNAELLAVEARDNHHQDEHHSHRHELTRRAASAERDD